jgi:hypothetical protein
MDEWLVSRDQKLREAFKLNSTVKLLNLSVMKAVNALPQDTIERLSKFNIEWHLIPSEKSVPMNDAYFSRLYPQRSRDFDRVTHHTESCREGLVQGHSQHQGQLIGVETTQKPRYLPGNRQFYGTYYGFDASADPFAIYLGRANLTSGTRFAHDFTSLRRFIEVVTEDWQSHSIMPPGYRLTICPPAVFNLIGNVFHPEWSETESLELGYYRDSHGNAICYAVGCNAPGDFSLVHQIETDSDWTLLGFRLALVPG